MPGITVNTWGFQGFGGGQVGITKYAQGVHSYESNKGWPVGGTTPLHVAIRLAVDSMAEGNHFKCLTIVTDGGPAFEDRFGSFMATKHLQVEVRNEIVRARRMGICVSVFLIGTKTESGGVVYDVVEEAANFMFGVRGWAQVDADSIGSSLVGLVTKTFKGFVGRA